VLAVLILVLSRRFDWQRELKHLYNTLFEVFIMRQLLVYDFSSKCMVIAASILALPKQNSSPGPSVLSEFEF
jgi:hypothetical protein